jgi:hypothetical protein
MKKYKHVSIIIMLEPLLGNTSKQTTKQHLLLGNRFLISKYTRPLQGDTFVDRHDAMEMIGATMEKLCFLRGPCLGVISETRYIVQKKEFSITCYKCDTYT